MQYAPPTTGGAASAPAGKGHGPFSEQDIQQIMADTGYDYQTVCDDIDRTGAQTKEELYPQFYSGQGIQPAAGQMMGAGMTQPGPPVATPQEEMAPAPAAPSADALPPEALEAMHQSMAPPPTPPGRPEARPLGRKRMQDMDQEM